LDVTFNAGHLAGKAQPRHRLQAQRTIEQTRAVDESVAVKPAEARELRVLQSRDCTQDACLLAMTQLGLKADHVVERAERIILAQLYDSVRLYVRRVRIGEPDRLHRSEAQGFGAALGHHLDRQAAFEIRRLLELLEFRFLAGKKRRDKRLVPCLIEWA